MQHINVASLIQYYKEIEIFNFFLFLSLFYFFFSPCTSYSFLIFIFLYFFSSTYLLFCLTLFSLYLSSFFFSLFNSFFLYFFLSIFYFLLLFLSFLYCLFSFRFFFSLDDRSSNDLNYANGRIYLRSNSSSECGMANRHQQGMSIVLSWRISFRTFELTPFVHDRSQCSAATYFARCLHA